MRRNLIVGRQLEPDDKRSTFGRIARQDRQFSALRQVGRRRLSFDVARPSQQNHFVLCNSWHYRTGQQCKRYNCHTHVSHLPCLFGLDAAFTIPEASNLIEHDFFTPAIVELRRAASWVMTLGLRLRCRIIAHMATRSAPPATLVDTAPPALPRSARVMEPSNGRFSSPVTA
jgi:hypothetical protein